MEFPYANLCCVLKVNTRCDACKRKTLEVLNAICGVYSVTIDAEEGTAKITGQVDPNVCLSALARTGQHAELVTAKLNHPRLDRTSYNYNTHYYNDGLYDSNHGYCTYPQYGSLNDPYCHGYSALPRARATWHDPYRQYPLRRAALPEYSSYNSNYCYDSTPMAHAGRPWHHFC